jgi:GH25 family lysozyme M1 (1,4-beta-N-acetylmuramidase)
MPRAPLAIALLLTAFVALVQAQPSAAAPMAPQNVLPDAPLAEGVLEGIDVSHWQNTINWSQVAAAGKSFAIIKVTEGEKFLDWAYAQNIAGARAAGVRATAYHFAQPAVPASEANIQADWYVENARLRAGDIVPALDLEVRNGLSTSDLQAWVLTWLQRVEARLGVKPMIYVSPSFWRNFMGDTRMFADLGYDVLWIAHWGVSNPSLPGQAWGGKGWTFWQYSNQGSVPGISGRVDLNRYNGTDLSPVLYGPGKPTAVSGTPGDRHVQVSWTPPASSSGGAITSYRATASPGGASCTTTGTSCTVGGLSNGTAYTFTVAATNASGTGLPSNPSPSVTPRTVPDAPTAASATPGNASAQVSWKAPGWNGGAPITGYRVTSSPGGRTCTTDGSIGCTVDGLSNGASYTFTVAATNAAGTGHGSAASAAVVPRTVPGPPRDVSAIAGDSFGLVAWSAPASNGGASINGYTVTASPGGRTCATGASVLSCEVTGLSNGTAYTFRVTASNVAGTGSPSQPSASITPWPPTPTTYVPVAPQRLLDTRSGIGLSGQVRSRSVEVFQVTGRAGIPAGATAITGNLTVTGQTASGWLTLGPAAGGVGGFSTLNFPVGDDRANGTTVSLGPGGTLSVVFDGAPPSAVTHVVFDVTGYFVPDDSGATYGTVTPNRILDTRTGNGIAGALRAGIPEVFQVTDRHKGTAAVNIPAAAIAVTGNLTVTGQTWGGWFTVTPSSDGAPSTSTLNFPRNDNRANGLTVPLGKGGTLAILYRGGPASATAHAIFDVTGYFVPGSSGAKYVPLMPNRILDSRDANGLAGRFQMGTARALAVVDRRTGDASRNVPESAIAATGNLTVTAQTGAGWLTATPELDHSPPTSTLNFPMNDNRANGLTVALADGRLSVVYNGAPAGHTTHAIFDITGYYVRTP